MVGSKSDLVLKGDAMSRGHLMIILGVGLLLLGIAILVAASLLNNRQKRKLVEKIDKEYRV